MQELPDLTQDQLLYARNKLFKSHLYKTKKETTCLDCGCKWDSSRDPKLSAALLGDTCPQCQAKLHPLNTPRTRTGHQSGYIGMACVVSGYQVFRFWYMTKVVKAGEQARYYSFEVAQNWINEQGKLTPAGMRDNPMGWGYGERWVWGSSIEIRGNAEKYYILTKNWFPYKKVLPIIKRNGYKGTFHGLQAGYFCELILTNRKAETLLKSGQKHILNHFYTKQNDINKYWASIKVAIRHHYTVTNPSEWFDHLNIMRYLDMDILNPQLICLSNFRTEHQRLIDRQNKVREKRRYEKEKRELAQAEIDYYEAKKRFLDLEFKDGDLTVSPLQSVAEFYKEGETMRHCVNSDRFYNDKASLILSAKHKGKRTETVHIDLASFSILESRGLQNKFSKHHDNIVTLVSSNMKHIRKAAKVEK